MNKVKEITDSTSNTNLIIKDIVLSPISYTKTSKLLTALYIVTDIIDINEPIRQKLRILGANIVSDIYSKFSTQMSHLKELTSKINEVLSFLEIAENLKLVSGMNSGILKKEFLELRRSIEVLNPSMEMADLFTVEEEYVHENRGRIYKGQHNIGRDNNARIGVQKGSTFMKALSDKISSLPPNVLNKKTSNNFDVLKGQRREEILKVIKINPSGYSNGLTITDIKNTVKDFGAQLDIKALPSCGEKTLQRELFSMVKDNILNKTGAKRWSRYLVKV
ncbi:hypothetical protein HZA26_01365 [Candidatus Nomurabacteria bacterium]|nr:hypothetical protein [Candidatus Nomurabacteria bacterium]